MNEHQGNGRPLREEERRLIIALLPSDAPSTLRASVDTASVVDLHDEGMGSIRFVRNGSRRRNSALAEAQYHDADGVMVSIELNSDESGDLFELDFWKVDFSPLREFPRPQDLRTVDR